MENKPPWKQEPTTPRHEGPQAWQAGYVDLVNPGTNEMPAEENNPGTITLTPPPLPTDTIIDPGPNPEPAENNTGAIDATPENGVAEINTGATNNTVLIDDNNTGPKRRGPKVRFPDHRRVEIQLGPKHLATLARYRGPNDSMSAAARRALERLDVCDAVDVLGEG